MTLALGAAALAADARTERRQLLALSSPALLVVALVVFVPVGWLFWLSFFDQTGATFANYQRLLDNVAYYKIFQTTFVLSAVVTLVTILLGYPLAYLLSQLSRRAALVGLALVLLPFWTSLLVRTYAWLVLLQRNGLINTLLIKLGLIDQPLGLVYNFTGAVIGMVHIMLPFLVLPLYASMKTIDPLLPRAAMSLGASPRAAFFTVFAPLTLPGLFAGSLLVFIYCLGFYIAPQVLGGGRVNMVAMKILENATTYFNWGAASALGVVLLAVTLAIFYLVGRFLPVGRLSAEER
ncbi:MAG TPA: ABC transporter permease [Hypericibacter adhaerens]|uniref:ABC transporter permease n=1 Tax=Hypericibacter adhaerens TaxID=2602016 RepID=UPI002CFBB2A7|nr:ABC transporter permease [Hypericibacter adhaerens]HWA43650.1 ABC transporter permease [Hypericibacter adhaerens]